MGRWDYMAINVYGLFILLIGLFSPLLEMTILALGLTKILKSARSFQRKKVDG
jgi:hypothetical protein